MEVGKTLDDIIKRLPTLRDNGVTQFSVDPNTGAISMTLAQKQELAQLPETFKDAHTDPFNDPALFGLTPGSSQPLSFRERAKISASQEK